MFELEREASVSPSGRLPRTPWALLTLEDAVSSADERIGRVRTLATELPRHGERRWWSRRKERGRAGTAPN